MTRPPRREKGFALLVIFLIAAAVAFTMYQELPRAAFESARDKEQLLMDRGNQYKRAIQVYYAVNKRYPAELKDLENTNEKRFLRHRYKDPMTGADEWRLVHTNGSFLTDSLVKKPPAQNAANGLPGGGQTPGGGPLGANNLNSAPPAPADANPAAFSVTTAPVQNAAAQRRPSDRGFPTGPGFPQNPNQAAANPFGANSAGFNPDDPRTWPAITLAQPNSQGNSQPNGQLGQPQNNGQMTGQVGAPTGQTFPGQQGQFQPQAQGGPGQFAGLGGANPRPFANPLGPNGQFPAMAPNGDQSPAQVNINQSGQLVPQPNQPVPPAEVAQQPFNGPLPVNNAPQFGQNSFNSQPVAPFQRPNPVGTQPAPPSLGAPAGNAALDAINNQLFRPNQAPAAGAMGSPGIAGVASKFEGPSIKAYRERTKYQEWEFVYEPATNQPGQTGVPGQNPNGLGQNGLGQNGMGQNGMGQNGASQGQGQAPGGATQQNPFSMPNPFAPQTPNR